ncbi:hypothetical protein BaRGS_00015852 [Batillaria attramentaria]|uniref:Uncharacterized protein n=1 Tax=Batillaria attramentaria TaxID=370345 RepID=A0ABD0L0A7_9CAEN
MRSEEALKHTRCLGVTTELIPKRGNSMEKDSVQKFRTAGDHLTFKCKTASRNVQDSLEQPADSLDYNQSIRKCTRPYNKQSIRKRTRPYNTQPIRKYTRPYNNQSIRKLVHKDLTTNSRSVNAQDLTTNSRFVHASDLTTTSRSGVNAQRPYNKQSIRKCNKT